MILPHNQIEFYGDQVRWFVGDVVSLGDPLQVGRIRVRIHGVHSNDKVDIPDEDLPWAQVVASISEGGTDGLGNPLGIQVGALVFGIFFDGKNSQLPLIFGSIPKLEGDSETSSVNQLARGTNTIAKTPNPLFNGEDASPYAAEYPHNKVTQTKSGHVIEIDDTPNAERIQIYHKSGTCVHFHTNGDVVTYMSNGFKTVTGNEKIHVVGDMEITADKNINIKSTGGNINIETPAGKIYLN